MKENIPIYFEGSIVGHGYMSGQNLWGNFDMNFPGQNARKFFDETFDQGIAIGVSMLISPVDYTPIKIILWSEHPVPSTKYAKLGDLVMNFWFSCFHSDGFYMGSIEMYKILT